MIIKTNFKDYYDHVAHIYGGGDPKIVYVRPHRLKVIPEMKYLETVDKKYMRNCFKCKAIQDIVDLHNRWNSWKNERTGVRGIVIGDIFFAQIKMEKEEEYRLVNEKDMADRKHWHKSELNNYINRYDQSLITICRMVNLPVFSFDVKYNGFEVNEYTPKLGEIGIASYISPNDMYQHLSYFIGNTMKISPDDMEKIPVPDKIKIEGHGFDYKTSFRGKM